MCPFLRACACACKIKTAAGISGSGERLDGYTVPLRHHHCYLHRTGTFQFLRRVIRNGIQNGYCKTREKKKKDDCQEYGVITITILTVITAIIGEGAGRCRGGMGSARPQRDRHLYGAVSRPPLYQSLLFFRWWWWWWWWFCAFLHPPSSSPPKKQKRRLSSRSREFQFFQAASGAGGGGGGATGRPWCWIYYYLWMFR